LTNALEYAKQYISAMGYKAHRKIQLSGRSKSPIIHLPKEWTEFYGLEQGDEVVLIGDAFLVIAPKHLEEKARRLIEETQAQS